MIVCHLEIHINAYLNVVLYLGVGESIACYKDIFIFSYPARHINKHEATSFHAVVLVEDIDILLG